MVIYFLSTGIINNIMHFERKKKTLYVILYKIPEKVSGKHNIVKNLTKW